MNNKKKHIEVTAELHKFVKRESLEYKSMDEYLKEKLRYKDD